MAAEQAQRVVSPEEKARQQRMAHEMGFKQKAIDSGNFKYLDIFEKQLREHKQAQKEFYET